MPNLAFREGIDDRLDVAGVNSVAGKQLARHGRELSADISGVLDRLDGWAREARATVAARPAHY